MTYHKTWLIRWWEPLKQEWREIDFESFDVAKGVVAKYRRLLGVPVSVVSPGGVYVTMKMEYNLNFGGERVRLVDE